MENYIFNGKIHYKSQFSIAMLNYQRVFVVPFSFWSIPFQKKDKNLDPDDPVAIQERNPD